MRNVLINIKDKVTQEEKLLAVLIDPDKMNLHSLPRITEKLNASNANYIFVGGSEVKPKVTQELVIALKKLSNLPVVLFPGDVTQITEKADALLFLSLISGRNPDYLIDQHVKAVPLLEDMDIEVIPTGYILVENGKVTSVEKVTKTQPISRQDVEKVVHTAKAGELLGHQLMYLEAGSGASEPINAKMIAEVKKALDIPLIVGGGIRTKDQLVKAYSAGADLVVIGTAFEENESFFEVIK